MDCPECGTRLEEHMRFCPHCGASLTDTDAGDDAASQRHPVTSPTTSIDVSRLFSTRMLSLAIAVGILVLFIGAISCNVADSSDGQKAGLVIYNFGGFVLGGTLFLGALVNRELDRYMRVGMLIAGALVVGLALSPGMVSSASYSFP